MHSDVSVLHAVGCAQARQTGRGTRAKATASAITGASRAMLSQNILHGAETDCVTFSQHSLGRSSQELTDKRLHVLIRQSVSHSPHARNATATGSGVAVRLL